MVKGPDVEVVEAVSNSSTVKTTEYNPTTIRDIAAIFIMLIVS